MVWLLNVHGLGFRCTINIQLVHPVSLTGIWREVAIELVRNAVELFGVGWRFALDRDVGPSRCVFGIQLEPTLKPGLGIGRWLRPATEVLVLAVSGKPTLLENTGRKAFIDAPSGRHSQKPVEVYDFIERLSPETRLEMFAREARPGWFRHGLEA